VAEHLNCIRQLPRRRCWFAFLTTDPRYAGRPKPDFGTADNPRAALALGYGLDPAVQEDPCRDGSALAASPQAGAPSCEALHSAAPAAVVLDAERPYERRTRRGPSIGRFDGFGRIEPRKLVIPTFVSGVLRLRPVDDSRLLLDRINVIRRPRLDAGRTRRISAQAKEASDFVAPEHCNHNPMIERLKAL
jgi:hypothetical protein